MIAHLLLAVLVLTPDSFEERQLEKELINEVASFDRFVDIGVRLITVRKDPRELEFAPSRLPVVRERRFGGVVDTKHSTPHICSGSDQPRVWHCSEDQEQLILHPDNAPRGQLVVGSEGAGKTTALAMWHYLRWLENLGERREGGQTAPTLTRLGLVQSEFAKLWNPTWCKYVHRDEFTGYELCDGSRIRFQHTHRQSQAAGSPIQGFNWSWCGRDEAQDQVDVHEDIENRGRAAKHGGSYYKQLGTATAKDESEWRTLRDRLEASKDPQGKKLWTRSLLYGRRSPFVGAAFWEAKKQTMSPREYARRIECKDVGPERATYPDWSRETNLIEVPELGWIDVTENELRAAGANLAMLVGHDPGTLWDVSLLGKAYVKAANHAAYLRNKHRPMWVIRGEVNTEQSTTEVHIGKLLERVRPMHLNLLTSEGKPNPYGRQILVRGDPAGESDARTHKSVYTQFANAGIKIKPAAYNATNDGHGRVPIEAGVELINTLICNAAQERHLFIERLADGSPAAPKLCAALESSERDAVGKAEGRGQKGKPNDPTHWPAALRYMLWAIERPRLQLLSTGDA